MRNKWRGIVLILCIVIGVAVGTAYCFKDILGERQSPEVVEAKQPESDQTTDTEQTEETFKVQKSSETTEAFTSEEASSTTTEEPPEEAGYNGDTFEDNGQPYMIKVNRKMNVVTIYTLDDEGYYTVPYKAMVCSVGLNNKTPTGTFKMQSDRYEWRELVGRVYGQYAVRIRRSIMFHSVPYYRPEKDQLESEEYNKLGEPASKGCVRLSVEDAKWIYDNCQKGTIVQIFDSDYIGPLGKPEPIRMALSDERCCYDPTDEDEDNPWLKSEETPVTPNAVKGSMAAANESQKGNEGQALEAVTDDTAPEITLRKDAPKTLTETQAQDMEYLISLVKVTDESEIAKINVSLPLWVSTKIDYRVVYTARDIYGNVATAYFAFEIEN